ncbi:hypothetical protein E2C01_049435 [Portunus trituberculatus]|uniref:Uncharacterized protein n=1 Tax=Portunus trituberculatus TaxID=210409 RepID=A0A5B7GDV9_PORTR|nr:hypothetical protein [Portunus trituberculatus]
MLSVLIKDTFGSFYAKYENFITGSPCAVAYVFRIIDSFALGRTLIGESASSPETQASDRPRVAAGGGCEEPIHGA